MSGDTGGGKIAIGGGGANTRTQSFTPAVSTTIASGARLDASALTRGDGGEILVFTDLMNPLALTQVAGSLIARGGVQRGNGGFIETSGYTLDVNAAVVSTAAPHGKIGMWLLDPFGDVEIRFGATTVKAGLTCTASVYTSCVTINAAELVTTLNGTNVEITSDTGSISLTTNLSWSTTSGTTLTLNALLGTISNTGTIPGTGTISGSSLVLNARTVRLDRSVSITGALTVNATNIAINQSVTAGGSITLQGQGGVGGNLFADSVQTATSGSLEGTSIMIKASAVTLGGPIISAGNLVIKATSINVNNSVTVDGLITLTGLGVLEAEGVPFEPGNLFADSVQTATLGSLEGSSVNIKATAVTLGSTVRSNGEAAGDGVTISDANTVAINSAITSGGLISVTAVTSITVGADLGANQQIALDAGTGVIGFTSAVSTFFQTSLKASTISFGNVGSFTTTQDLSIGQVSGPTTTLTASASLTLTGENIRLLSPLAWDGFALTLTTPLAGAFNVVAVNGNVTGTGGASLSIPSSIFQFGDPGGVVTLTGTTPSNASVFTYQGIVKPTGTYDGVSVTVTNTAGGGGGGSIDTPVVVVTPAAPTTNTTAADAAAAAAKSAADAAAAKSAADAATAKPAADAATAKAAADAATAKAAADAATAQAAANAAAAKAAADVVAKAVVDQALTQAVATVVASTSAAVFVAPPPAPPASTTTSSTSTTLTTGSGTTSANTASTTTATTTATTATTTAAVEASQNTVVTQDFFEPLSVTTLSSITSTVNDPGDTSAATTSTNSGPASQTATPASTASAAPSAPSLTPVVVSKDGADAGDFTLQTVKPPAPVTTAKQEARPTERVTTTPVSPGIALQATQKTPAPSGSVLGREISGSGNSSNW